MNKLFYVIVATILVLSTNANGQTVAVDSSSVVTESDSVADFLATVKVLEDAYQVMKDEEKVLISDLRKAKLYSSKTKKSLPDVPKGCGQKPNFLSFKKRKEYRECLTERNEAMQFRLDAMQALLPNKPETPSVPSDTTTVPTSVAAVIVPGTTGSVSTVNPSVSQKKTTSTGTNGIAITLTTATAIDLNDTTAANADAIKKAKQQLNTFSKNHKYGSDLTVKLLPTDSLVVVTEVANVTSGAHKAPETQWVIEVTGKDGKVRVYVDKQQDPATALTDGIQCLSTATGCGVKGAFEYATKAGDNSGGEFTGLME